MFAKCMTSQSLIGKIPAAQLKKDAAVYEKRGMDANAAMIRAVEDKLSMLALEEKKIIQAVRSAYEADGGTTAAPKAPAAAKVESSKVAELKAAVAADTYGHDVDVYETLAAAPDYIRQQAEKEGATDVEGFFDPRTNRVGLVAENIATPERAKEVARHELIGHYGLENMVGSAEMANLAQRVIKAEADGNKVIIELAKQVDATQPGLSKQRRAKEIMAVMAERNVQNSITKRIIDAIRTFLKQAGFIKSDITDAEIAGLLRDAQSYLKQQGRGMEAGEAAPAFSREPASFSFAGSKARKADVHAKETAQKRLDNGDNADTVRKETGWFKGVDDKWRFEISDKDASFKAGEETSTNPGAFADWMDEAQGRENGVPLSQALDHPALFAAYPNLAAVRLKIDPKLTGLNANYGTNNGRGVITIPDPFSLIAEQHSQLLGVVLHEVQHAIQDVEGFAKGGNLHVADVIKAQAKQDWDYWSNAYSIKREMENGMSAEEAAQALNELDFGVNDDHIREAKSHSIEELKQKNDAAEKEMFGVGKGSARDRYMRIAGEVEARNVQTRQNMTDAERTATPPSKTADVSDQDVIIVFNGKEMLHAPAIANADINFSRSGRTAPLPGNPAANGPQATLPLARSAFAPSDPGALDNLIRAMQDNKIDLKRVQQAIVEAGGTITERENAYLNEELYIGKVKDQLDKLADRRVKPLLAAIDKAGFTLEQVNDYLYARHAPERNAAMKRINAGPGNDALSGMTDAEAARIIAAATPKQAEYDAIAAMVDSLQQETRQRIVSQGLETAQTVAQWQNAYAHYVPLKRDVDSDIKSMGSGSGYQVKGKESQRAMGSNKVATNILANVIIQSQGSIVRSEKAKVARSVLDLVRSHPNDNFWKVDSPPMKRHIDPNTGLVTAMQDPNFKAADNVLTVKENGVEHYVVFNENNERAMQLAAAMKNLDAAQLPKWVAIAGKGTRYLAQWITARNPLFWVTNFARDVQGAAFNLSNTPISGKEATVLASIPQAMKGYWKITRGDGTGQWANYAREFKSAGSETGFIDVFGNASDHMAALEKQLKQMQQGAADPRKLARSMVDMIDDYNTIIENGVRLAVYQTGRKNGMTIRQAASMAKNITVNFNRKGNETGFFNSLYMFMNANIQGNTRFLTAVATSRKAQVVAASLIGMGLVLDIMGRAFGGDDEDTGRKNYDEISDFEKERNWIFMHPDGSGKYKKIPMPIGVHIMPNIGRLISESLFSSKKQDPLEKALSMTRILVDAFNPMGSAGSFIQMVTPSVLKPIAQIEENKSFHGGPHHKEADGRGYEAPAYTRHFRSTAEHWVEASKLLNDISGGDAIKPGQLNVPPEVLRTLIMSYVTPGITQTVDKTIDTSRRSAKGEKIEASQVPVLSRFHGEAPEERAKERAYYEEQKRLKQSVEQIKQYDKARNREASEAIYAELGDGDARKGRRVRAQFEGAEKELTRANKERKGLETDKRPDEEQRAELDRNRARRLKIMQRLLKVDADDE